MSKMEIVQSLGFSMPMFAALICCILLAMYKHRCNEPTQRKLIRIMIFTYISAVLCLAGIVLYIVNYKIYVWYNPLFFLVMTFDQVLLYHLMFILTRVGNTRKFNPVHYIIPLAYTILLAVWSFLTPYEVQYYLVESRGDFVENYRYYSMAHLASVPTFIIYNTIYPLMALRRIKIYKQEIVNYSADEQRNSAKWLYNIILLIWLSLPLTLATLFWHKNVIFNSPLTIIGVLPMIFQYIIICYNLLVGNYVIIKPPTAEEGEDNNNKHSNLNRIRFELYIKKNKPYLDPKLKITDMCTELGTNRTYLSSYINREFGMNFSRYMNRCRLEELDRLRTNPNEKYESGMELVLRAGFSSYRNYVRVKSEEDKTTLLKDI